MALSMRVVVFLGLIYATLMSVACSQSIAPAPAPTSDGKFSWNIFLFNNLISNYS